MGITDPIQLEVAPRVARGGNGPVRERDRLQVLEILADVEGFDTDAPGDFSRRGISQNNVTAGRDETAGKAVCLEDGEGRVGGVSLRDASEVEEHAIDLFGDGPFFGVENEMVKTGAGLGARDLLGAGEGVVLFRLPPEADEGAGRDVEGALRLAGELAGGLEDAEEIRAGREGGVDGDLGEGVDLRFRKVVGKGAVEFGDPGKGTPTRPGQVVGPTLFGPGAQGELRAHVRFGEGEQFPVRGLEGGGEEGKEEKGECYRVAQPCRRVHWARMGRCLAVRPRPVASATGAVVVCRLAVDLLTLVATLSCRRVH